MSRPETFRERHPVLLFLLGIAAVFVGVIVFATATDSTVAVFGGGCLVVVGVVLVILAVREWAKLAAWAGKRDAELHAKKVARPGEMTKEPPSR